MWLNQNQHRSSHNSQEKGFNLSLEVIWKPFFRNHTISSVPCAVLYISILSNIGLLFIPVLWIIATTEENDWLWKMWPTSFGISFDPTRWLFERWIFQEPSLNMSQHCAIRLFPLRAKLNVSTFSYCPFLQSCSAVRTFHWFIMHSWVDLRGGFHFPFS